MFAAKAGAETWFLLHSEEGLENIQLSGDIFNTLWKIVDLFLTFFLGSSLLFQITLRRIIPGGVIIVCFSLPGHDSTSSVFFFTFQTAELLIFIKKRKAALFFSLSSSSIQTQILEHMAHQMLQAQFWKTIRNVESFKVNALYVKLVLCFQSEPRALLRSWSFASKYDGLKLLGFSLLLQRQQSAHGEASTGAAASSQPLKA